MAQSKTITMSLFIFFAATACSSSPPAGDDGCGISNCADNYVLNQETCRCEPAADDGDSCAINSCAAGYVLDERNCRCVEAPDCAIASCVDGFTLDQTLCQCVEDPPCAVTSCADGYVLDEDKCACVEEPLEGLRWYTTCGDPVCGGDDTPLPTENLCTDDQVEGEPCTEEDAFCNLPGNRCHIRLRCADADPKRFGCPDSQRAVKRDIHYVTPAEQQSLAEQLLATKLATYQYRDESTCAPRRLGFIIDDQPENPAVRPGGERVDLYAYMSMGVATAQTQQQQIQALEKELAALRREVVALKKAAK